LSALAALAMLLPGGVALAMPAETLVATYTASPPGSVPASNAFVVSVMLTNTGTETWRSTAPGLVNLSYHWYDASGTTVIWADVLGGNAIVWDGRRTPLVASVDPGATATVNATVIAPPSACACALTFDLVREGVAWFGTLGSSTMRLLTTVAPITYAAGYNS